MSVMYLDIASIPDFQLGARMYDLHDLSDIDIARIMSTKNREKEGGSDELGQHLRQIAAVSILLQNDEGIILQTSGGSETNELQHLQFLAAIIDQHKPEIITWDRCNIIPILNYRCLSHGLQMPLARSTDVTDLNVEIAESEGPGSVSLNEAAILSGLPGNKAMSDEYVLNTYLEGGHELIRINLELNIIMTCLIHQRWQVVCGEIDQSGLEKNEFRQLKESLLQEDQTHLTDFVNALK